MEDRALSLERIVVLATTYAVTDRLLRWAGILRYFAQQPNPGFSISRWGELDKPCVDREVLQGFLRILSDAGLVQFRNGTYYVMDDFSVQRVLEDAHTVIRLRSTTLTEQTEPLLWTQPKISNLPSTIAGRFRSLDSWVRTLIQQARSHVIFVAPYFSEGGIQTLEASISALLRNQTNVTLDWIVSDLNNEMNCRAFRYLSHITKAIAADRVGIYCPEKGDDGLWFHAKFLLVDRLAGYMGSANFSRRAFDEQFELGLSLGKSHTEALWDLVTFLKNGGYLKKVDLGAV